MALSQYDWSRFQALFGKAVTDELRNIINALRMCTLEELEEMGLGIDSTLRDVIECLVAAGQSEHGAKYYKLLDRIEFAYHDALDAAILDGSERPLV